MKKLQLMEHANDLLQRRGDDFEKKISVWIVKIHTHTHTHDGWMKVADLFFKRIPFYSQNSLGAWWEMFSPRATLPLAKLHNASLKDLRHLPP